MTHEKDVRTQLYEYCESILDSEMLANLRRELPTMPEELAQEILAELSSVGEFSALIARNGGTLAEALKREENGTLQ